eukprot:gene4578-9096_t
MAPESLLWSWWPEALSLLCSCCLLTDCCFCSSWPFYISNEPSNSTTDSLRYAKTCHGMTYMK